MLISRAFLVAFVTIVVLVASITSQQALSDKQQQALTSYLKEQLKTASTPQQIHYIVASLLKLGNSDAAQAQVQQLCEKVVKNADVKSMNADQLYHLAAAQLGLKCDIPNDQTFYDDYEKRLETILTDQSKSVTDMEQAYNAARSLLLYRKKMKTLPNNNSLLGKIFNNIINKFSEANGAFCDSTTDGNKCLRDTGLAYETLSILHSIVSNKNELLKSLVKVSKQAPHWLKKVASSATTKATSAFVRGLNRLASILPLSTRITRQEIEDSANAFIRDTGSNLTLDSAYDIIEGISSVSGSNVHVPIIVSNVEGEDNKYRFRITNVLGQPFKNANVKLKAVYPGNNVDDSLFGRAIELKGDKGVYSWEDTSKQIGHSAGAYKFDIDVQLDKDTTSFTRIFKTFASKLDISDVSVLVGRVGDRRNFVEEVSYSVAPETTLENAIPITVSNDQQRLVVALTLRGIEPQQLFARIGDNERESIAVLRKSTSSHYRVEIPLEKIGRDHLSAPLHLRNSTGVYDLQLIIGDASLQKPLLWTLAKLDLVYTVPLKPDEEGRHYAPQPEIKHKFQEPANRASASIASTYSLVVAAPAVLFIIGMLAIGFNFNNCPSGIDALLALVFTAIIGAMLAVIGLYFIEINIFTALNYLGVLGVASVLVGSRVLGAVAQKSESKTK
jgi:hypothetical protein